MNHHRTLIVERIRDRGYSDNWLLDVYHHLTERGVSSTDAISAMTCFVDDLVAMKKRTMAESMN
jgi:hypothetical protein